MTEPRIIELREGDRPVRLNGLVSVHTIGTFSQGNRSGKCVKLLVEPKAARSTEADHEPRERSDAPAPAADKGER